MAEQKVIVYGIDGSKKETIDLPKVFSTPPRKDIISRAVISIELGAKQPQGRDPMAGMRNTARSWGSGYGVARPPRLRGSGYPTARNAAFIPGVVGGRLAHPPRTYKIIKRKINKKERRLALMCAISATGNPELVKRRGHKIDSIPSIPLVVDDKIQTVKKTSTVMEIFSRLGLKDDLMRVKENIKIRAGKGKRRGRRRKIRKSVLLVIKDDFGISKAARNIPGVDVVNINVLNCSHLAPGSKMGRLTVWALSAFKSLYKIGE